MEAPGHGALPSGIKAATDRLALAYGLADSHENKEDVEHPQPPEA